MKTTLIATSAAGALAILAGAALAQSTAGAPTEPARAPHAMRADADRDGRISRTEFVDGRIARLTAVDANRDGSVSAEERRSGMDTRRNQRVSARFETLDKNGDGALSREEFAAGPGPGRRQGMADHRGHRGGSSERAQARRPVPIAEAQTRVAARFDRLDLDRDGFITVQERRAARDTMRDQHRARRAVGQPSPSGTASE